MKIVHEVNQLDFGGVEKVVRNIIKFDKNNEHTIITYKDGNYRSELEKAGAKIVVLADPKEAIEQEADIIHVHTGGSSSRLAEQLGHAFPIIETIHSPVRSLVPLDKIKQRIGVSNAVTNKNYNCKTIYNGLDIDDCFAEWNKSSGVVRAELGISPEATVIGRLGRLGRDKGLEEWLLTCYYLQKAGHEITPLIVGGCSKDDERYIGKLKLMIESMPIKNVIWAGNKVDILNYLQVMDIFLYPSITEGFGLVFAEALLAGCAVVACKTDVTHELFGGFALLVENTIPELVKGVEKMLDPTVRSEFNGSEWVQEQYNAQKMSKEYQELYERSA